MIVGNPGIGAAIRRPDSFTKLHLRMNGEGNVFKDLTGKTITTQGNPTQKYPSFFVGKCGYFDGNGSCIILPNVTDLNISSGDFTFKFYLNIIDFSTANELFAFGENAQSYCSMRMQVTTSGSLIFLVSTTGSSWSINATICTLTLNTRYSISIIRQSSVFVIYVNDILLYTNSSITGNLYHGDHNTFGLIYYYATVDPTPSYGVHGYASEFEISKIAKFMPSTRRF